MKKSQAQTAKSKPEPENDPVDTAQALAVQAVELAAGATELKIVSAYGYLAAKERLDQIKAKLNLVNSTRMGITRKLDAAKAAIMDLFRPPQTTLERAESAIKRSMLAYSQEEDRKRQEAQRKLDEQARKDQEKLNAQAAKAAAAGKPEKAEQLEQRAAMVVAPVVQTAAPKVAGISIRKIPKYEVTDKTLLPEEYKMQNDAKIGAVVRALKMDANIPGVRVYMEDSLASGAH